jgi:hypothetical protein
MTVGGFPYLLFETVSETQEREPGDSCPQRPSRLADGRFGDGSPAFCLRIPNLSLGEPPEDARQAEESTRLSSSASPRSFGLPRDEDRDKVYCVHVPTIGASSHRPSICASRSGAIILPLFVIRNVAIYSRIRT